jgi:hypothetical protein
MAENLEKQVVYLKTFKSSLAPLPDILMNFFPAGKASCTTAVGRSRKWLKTFGELGEVYYPEPLLPDRPAETS